MPLSGENLPVWLPQACHIKVVDTARIIQHTLGGRNKRQATSNEKRRNTMQARKIMAGLLFLLSVVNTASVSGKDVSPWQMGTLVGFDARITTTPGIRNEHYEQREKKAGKKVIDGYSYGGEQTQVTYVLTVTVGDITYTTEHIKNLFFGYNPTDMVVNDAVTVSVQKNKLVLIRPDGKEYKTTIVRTERNVRIAA
jgi:hypothetical protein